MNVFDLISGRHGARHVAPDDYAGEVDRRRQPRTGAHWPLRFRVTTVADDVESVTQNLSSSGFYCISPVALTPGQLMDCTFRIPAHDMRAEQRAMFLECRAAVVRAESTSDGCFGIACRIKDYRLIRAARRGE